MVTGSRSPPRGEPVKIEAQAGKHGVVVKRGEDVLLGESVTIESGKQFKLTVRSESPAVPRPENTSPPADTGSRPNLSKSESRKDQARPDSVPGDEGSSSGRGGAVTRRLRDGFA